ncbi:MAG: glycosyltransferase family 39 protein, partial [Vicinamibacterales bacterium]|nr:glycosyltransferase family 39 protein [Vicinamibacterales bacterium]
MRTTAFWGILAVALVLRAWGLGYGLPAVYNPDEVAIMSRALAFATGDLNPHNFLYPTFYFYVLFAWVGASFVPAWVAGVAATPAEFQARFFADPTWVYLAGRWLGVACGVASVAATWALARRVAGHVPALAAALFLAVAPIAVRDAHYVKHDVPVTLAAVLAVLAMARLLTPREPGAVPHAAGWRAPALAGAACGVAFSTHYYAVFLALPLAFATWQATRDRGPAAVARALAIAGAASAVVFFALSPYLLPEWRTALRDIVANRQIVMDRAAQLEGHAWLPSAGDYARMLWQEGTGWPVLLLALAGFASMAWRDWRTTVLLSAFPLAFFLFISNTVAASRYLNPVLPFVAVFAGVAVSEFAAWRGRRAAGLTRAVAPGAGGSPSATTARRVTAAVATGLSVVAAIPGLVHSARTGRFFTQTDTRTLAQRFIEREVAPDTTVLLQPYSVPLQQSRESLV